MRGQRYQHHPHATRLGATVGLKVDLDPATSMRSTLPPLHRFVSCMTVHRRSLMVAEDAGKLASD